MHHSFTLLSHFVSLSVAVTVWAERGDVPQSCEWLWHSWDLHRRLKSGEKRRPAHLSYAFKLTVTLNRQMMFFILQCPHNVHKLDGYTCEYGQVQLCLPLLLLLHSVIYSCLFCIVDSLFFPVRVAVMEVAVRPEITSAKLCGASVCLYSFISWFFTAL